MRETRKKMTPEQEVLAFLRSMLKLVERRGWREVHFEFANYVLCMAAAILDSDGPEGQDAELKGRRLRVDPGCHVAELFETLERVPVPLFKGIINALGARISEPAEQNRAA